MIVQILKVYAYLAVPAFLFMWSCCVAARRGDDMADAAYRQLLREEGRP